MLIACSIKGSKTNSFILGASNALGIGAASFASERAKI